MKSFGGELYSLSFRCGIVPTMWELASEIPVYKKPPKSNPCNYRPVSLLSILSKIMEAIVNRQLVSFLDLHHFLPDSQYGFPEGRGTADVLRPTHSDNSPVLTSDLLLNCSDLVHRPSLLNISILVAPVCLLCVFVSLPLFVFPPMFAGCV